MTTTSIQNTYGGAQGSALQPVDRARRARFIASVVGFCLVMASLFTGLVAWGVVASIYMPIIELFISSLMSLAMATTLAYVGGSVVDYNGGVANMFTRSNNQNDYILPETEARG
ncbi:hypothetical protein MAL1_00089 [Bacteriophage DSS3_MAL1]|nr:hypothetical protein MAL1_00089 [Bacteriophage DSS3_MAL1]